MRSLSQHKPDYTLLALFGILLVFGLIMLTSASSPLGYEHFGDHYFFVKRQLFYGIIPGLVGFLFFSKISYAALKKIGIILFYSCLVMLVVVLIPGIGSEHGTFARSWFTVAGFSFQPAEFMKLGLIFFLSAHMAKIGEKLQDFKMGFLPTLGLGMIPIFLLMLQPDIGTSTIFFAIIFGMLFIAKADMWHLGALMGIAILGFALLIAVAPYRAARFTTFLHPELDPQGIGYHINQASLAIGSGGFFGLGYGHSRQKFQYLPEVHADSIFAVIAEEMGFFVSVSLIALFVAICFRGFHVAKNVPDDFGKYLMAGILVWFMVQAFFNISAMVGLMPITGVPLPFISHGGTALAVSLAAVGVLANVSKYSRQ